MLLDAIRPIRQCRGRPQKRPKKPYAGKGYGYERCRREMKKRKIIPWLAAQASARRGIESKDKLGRHRWCIERTLAWSAQDRRLEVRHERCAALF